MTFQGNDQIVYSDSYSKKGHIYLIECDASQSDAHDCSACYSNK